MSEPLLISAVAYDAKVVSIWEGMRDVLRSCGLRIDICMFGSYERQVESLLAGHVDIAWNTPLAHVRVKRRTAGRSLSLGMRDSDRDFRSRLLVRTDSGIRGIADLAGHVLAVGSRDSTQARILPIHFLQEAGLDVGSVQMLAFDTDIGKHGDTGTSELDVLRALSDGQATAGVVGDLVWSLEQAAGRVDPARITSIWTSPPFDHCMFDALPGLDPDQARRFTDALAAMSWENPEHRRILELEGLKQWMPPREEGYASLIAALDRQQGW